MNKVKKAVLESGTIIENINYVVGVSGGPDSLCLLDVLVEISKEKNIGIFPVHVNHKLRDTADEEQRHIEKICEDYGLSCTSYEVDCESMSKEYGMTIEEAGRAARYSAFKETADAMVEAIVGASQEQKTKDEDDGKEAPEITAEEVEIAMSRVVIATAHNADDQSETVMHRIIRGSGLHGLGGMRQIRKDEESGYIIVKPLLDVPREDIEDYIKKRELEPNIDESNFETDATRNKIRLELLPYIRDNLNPGIAEVLRRLADAARTDDDYLNQISDMVYQSAAEINTSYQRLVDEAGNPYYDEAMIIHIDKLADQHPAIIRRVIAIALNDFNPDQEITSAHINSVIETMFSANPSAHIDLVGGLICDRVYGDLVFRMPGEDDPASAEEHIHSSIRLIPMIIDRDEYDAKHSAKNCSLDSNNELFAAFDYDKFCETYHDSLAEIVVRTRREGDFIAISGGGRKKLQDFFVDSKIPKTLRETIPVVAVGSEILWIPPHDSFESKAQRNKGKYSQNYQIDNKTKEVLFLELVQPV